LISETMSIGIVLERREVDHPWQSHEWVGVAVIPGAPEIGEWRLLDEGEGWKRYHAGTLELEIFRKETQGYRLNLMNTPPKVFVVLRYDDEADEGETDDDARPAIIPFFATVCPYEAQIYLDGDEDLVEPIPMPDVVAAWLSAFIEKHHVDEPRRKRKQTPQAAAEDPRRPGIGGRPASPGDTT